LTAGVVVLHPGEGPIAASADVPASIDNITWGWLPNAASSPVAVVDDGDRVTIDTISHEGLMEDQGRDPVACFGRHGVHPDDVLRDARAVAEVVDHTYGVDGPHVVTGPVAVRGARRGDVLRVDVLDATARVPYGLVSNRHGLGLLAGELPETDGTVTTFCSVEDGRGVLGFGHPGGAVRFPLAPFHGIMGTAPATDEPVHSKPPGPHGGNVDLKHLAVGSSLYLPVAVDGALFYAGDPHFAQGNGEVCLTAFEASLRATGRLSIVRGVEARRACGLLADPFAETGAHWIPMGLHVDLDEAARRAARAAIAFLGDRFGMPRADAYAYLSAACDFELTQVVDGVLGVHCLIRKADFE
jgi:acetamidase/formamidase